MVQTLTLNTSTAIRGCTTWQGIINNGTVVTDNASIEDADVAIQANAGSTIKIANSIFDNNRLAVYFNGGNYSTSYIYNSSFDYSNLPEFAPNVIPYHILAENATNVLIGTDYGLTAANKNIFTHAAIGIYNRNSELTVCNCKFIKIGFNEVEQPGVIARYGDGIFATGVTGIAKKCNIGPYTLGLKPQPGCDFVGINDGITVNSNYIAEIKSNKFDLCFYGINIYGIPAPIACTLQANNFANCKYGINAQNCNATMSILDNLINMNSLTSPTAFIYTTAFGVHGINIRQPYLTNTKVIMHGNRINNCNYGITLYNLKGATAGDVLIGGNYANNTFDNTVYMQAPNGSGVMQTGINAFYCGLNTEIADNEVQRLNAGTSGLPEQDLYICINASYCPDILVNNNHTVNMGTDHRYVGSCTNISIRCNSMENSFQGFNFIKATITTGTDYGSSTDPTDKWNKGYANGSSTTNGRIVGTFNGSQLNWYHRNNVVANNMYCPYYPILGKPVTPKKATNPNLNTCDFTFANNDMDEIIDIIGDSVPYEEDTVENRFYEDEYAFNFLTENDSILNATSTQALYIQQWYAAKAQGNLGRFRDVNTYIEAKNTQAALIANASIVDTTLILQNFKTAQRIYLQYFFNRDTIVVLDSIDKYTLYNIAIQNAITGGQGVYMARAMLNMDIEDTYPILRKMQQSTTENQSNYFDALIYPNPTNGAFNLDYEIGKNDNGYLIIENAYGQLIDNINLDAQQHSQTFRIKSNIAGVYFISMHINAQLVFTKKLILIN